MSTKHCILIVDDDANVRRTLIDILKAQGYSPVATATGKAALNRIEEETPAVALIDLELEDLPGLELLAAIKRRSPDTECIVITGYASQASAIEAVNLGTYAYLQKPYAMNQLLLTIRRAVEKWEAAGVLRESEERYRSIVEHSQAGILIVDDAYRFIYVNDELGRILGRSRQEIVGHDFREFLDQESRQLVADRYARRQRGEKVSPRYEFNVIRPDGEKRRVEISSTVIRDPAGRVKTIAQILDITEHKQAEEEIRRRSEETAALLEVSLALNRLDLETLLPTIGERAKVLFAADGSRIFLLEPDGETLRCVLALHQRAETVLGMRIKLGQGVTGSVAAHGEPEIVNDLLGDPRAMQVPGTPVEQEAMMFVPLKERGRLLGVMSVSRLGHERPFRPADLELLKALASLVSAAISNARLFEAERAARKQAERLQAATQALTGTLDLQEVFERILSELRQVVPYDSASVQQLRGNRLEIIGGHGFPNLEELLGVSFDLTATDNPNREVISSRAPLILEDAPAHYAEFSREPHAQAGIRAWLGVPLLFGERLLGMIALDKQQPGFYTEEHARLAQAYAAQAAIAIQNARLFDETRRRNRELALLNRVIAASAARRDAESILETICRELALYLYVPQSAATLFNDEKTEAVVVAEYLDEGRPSAMGETIPVEGNPASQHLLAHKTPLVIEDAQTDPRLAPIHDLMRRRGTVSLLLVPLLVEGEVVGSLGVDAVERRPFSAEEVALAQRVAEQVSGALARARLEETQRRLSTAVEQAAESVVITDPGGTMLYVNPAFEQITGYSRAEAVGQHTRILGSDRHDPAFYREMARVAHAGQTWRGRMVNRKKDGSFYTVDAAIAPVRDPAGKIVNFVVTMRDVTREVLLEEQFHQAQKMESLGRLAGGVAHDFNNLLTVIYLSTRLLERQLLPEDPLWEHVQRIQETARRAAALTKQLLSFSRKEVVEPRRLDLSKVVGDLGHMLQRIIGEDIELVTDLAEDLWPVYMDPIQVEQIIMNLVVNARDAMPQGGTLTLETANIVLDEAYLAFHADAQPGEHVLLAISDTGLGMGDEVQAHLFEPFFTTKERGRGTGLGLATVYGIVKQGGGHIGVYSEVGQGTTFKIYLPRAEEEAARAPSRATPVTTVRGSETVLVVEDDKGVRELAAQILKGYGYRVLVAGSGPEALSISRGHEGPIHLLITDIVMPGMNGRELAGQLRAQRPETRVLYMSGYADDTIARHGVLEAGAAFLPKPLSVEGLLQKVRAVLDGRG